MRKGMIAVFAALLAGAAGFFYWNAQRTNAAKTEQPEFTTALVERAAIRQEVSCSGSVVSNLDVEIKCKASGQITTLPLDISDHVAKGELLVKLDPIDEERTVRKAEVQLASAEARLAQAKRSLLVGEAELKNARVEAQATLASAEASSKDLREKAQRTAALQEKKYASPEEVTSAEAAAVQAESVVKKARVGIEALAIQEQRLELLRQDIKLAEAEVNSNQIALEDARQRLTETQVYAPMSGVISDRMVQVGQIIASPTMNVSGGTALLVLSDLSRVFVLASVDESDVGHVRPGQSATITVDAFPDQYFRGEVVRVATKGANVSNVVTFEVKIEILDETKNKLLPEMTADVEILVAAKDDALSIPSEAITRQGPDKVVLVPGEPGEDPRSAKVKTGIENDTHTEILAGLQEGATILISQDQTDTSSDSKNTQGGPPGGFLGGPPPGGGPPP